MIPKLGPDTGNGTRAPAVRRGVGDSSGSGRWDEEGAWVGDEADPSRAWRGVGWSLAAVLLVSVAVARRHH